MNSAGRAKHRQRGAAAIGTSAGFVVFLVLLLAAVQVIFNLYANSLITTAAYDAASAVAGFDASDDRCEATARADRVFAETLGDYGRRGHVELDWTCSDPDQVTVRVTARHPSLLPERVVRLVGLGRFQRAITVRVETDR